MRLGTRWAVGATPPSTLPEVMIYAVSTVEEQLAVSEESSDGWRWTLTWLEGKPIVELDDGTIIRYSQTENSATITQVAETEPSDDDET